MPHKDKKIRIKSSLSIVNSTRDGYCRVCNDIKTNKEISHRVALSNTSDIDLIALKYLYSSLTQLASFLRYRYQYL